MKCIMQNLFPLCPHTHIHIYITEFMQCKILISQCLKHVSIINLQDYKKNNSGIIKSIKTSDNAHKLRKLRRKKSQTNKFWVLYWWIYNGY